MYQTSVPLLAVIQNNDGLYLGDLTHYFRILWKYAQNSNHPYHNIRHMLHVTWLSYQACVFYARDEEALCSRQMRDLLVAAMFHDFDHSGMAGQDDLNVERAVRGFRQHVLIIDQDRFASIEGLIRATQYPYTSPTEKMLLSGQIIRDADMGQTFSDAWIKQVIFGLAKEWGQEPHEVLKLQVGFLRQLKFHTAWGRATFPQAMIDAKLREVEGYLQILS